MAFSIDAVGRVTAVKACTPARIRAWVAATFTLPAIEAYESALRGGERLPVRGFGDAPCAGS